MPIIGPEHRDAEIINFPASHWHIDWRFVSARMMRHARSDTPYANVVQRTAYEHVSYLPDDCKTPLVVGEVEQHVMVCKRPWPEYPHAKRLRNWGRALDEAFKDCKLKGMVCPHRGLSLDGAHREGDVVTCPGHGLRWNVVTGELVRGNECEPQNREGSK